MIFIAETYVRKKSYKTRCTKLGRRFSGVSFPFKSAIFKFRTTGCLLKKLDRWLPVLPAETLDDTVMQLEASTPKFVSPLCQ
jgi:hypothetical protein